MPNGSYGGPLHPHKDWEKSFRCVSRKWGKTIFGGVAHFLVRPLGGPAPPIWPSVILGLGTLTRVVFFRRNRPLFGGYIPIWMFELWPTFSRNLVDNFSSISGNRQYPTRPRASGNLKKIYRQKFEKIASKVVWIDDFAIFTSRKYSKSRRL